MADALPPHVDLQAPLWLPHVDNAVLSMGLRKLPLADWLYADSNVEAYLANKRAETQRASEVTLQTAPVASAAIDELANLINPNAAVGGLTSSERLYRASLQIAEDICILLPGEADYTLQAAHLCAPSHWLLEQKMGCGLDAIHGPVPGYQPKLAQSVNRFISSLKPDTLVERFNWSLDATPSLSQRPADQSPEPVRRWYRVERQVLRRLPNSGAVVFTILVRHWPLWWLDQQAGVREGLVQAIDALTPELRSYKGLGADVVLDWRQYCDGS